MFHKNVGLPRALRMILNIEAVVIKHYTKTTSTSAKWKISVKVEAEGSSIDIAALRFIDFCRSTDRIDRRQGVP